MNYKTLIIYCMAVLTIVALTTLPSCTHDSVVGDSDPVDTITNDTTSNDTIIPNFDLTGIPCDDNVVYFENNVLPIIRKNCAISGCHSGGTYSDGVNLENYASIMSTAKVKPFDLDDSELYEVITETKADKVMPPPPMPKLSSVEIEIISKWISQGAMNNVCNPNYGKVIACSSENTTYSGFVKNLINNNCVNCHKGTNASGGIKLDSYENLLVNVNNGKFLGSITWKNGYQKMPFNQKKLDTCTINKIVNWIDNGAKNN